MRHHLHAGALSLPWVAVAVAATLGAISSDNPAEPHDKRPAGGTPRDATGQTDPQPSIDRLATSGPSTRESAVRLDGLPPAGFVARERPRVLAVARRFLNGYFAFEVGEGGRRAQRQVIASAPDLAADLLAGGTRLPATMDAPPPRAEVYAVAVEFDKPPLAAQVRAEVKRANDLSDIGVIVKRRGTQWTVTQIVE